MSREKTMEEVKEEFLNHIRGMVDYWNEIQKDTTKEKLNGLAFSILTMLDGYSSMPSFIVAPLPHEDDKEYNIENEEDYYPENHNSDVKCDIAGSLHELFYKK
jgi:hypothetical protein